MSLTLLGMADWSGMETTVVTNSDRAHGSLVGLIVTMESTAPTHTNPDRAPSGMAAFGTLKKNTVMPPLTVRKILLVYIYMFYVGIRWRIFMLLFATYEHDVHESMKPFVGQIFDSLEAAEAFYKSYAKEACFGVRIGAHTDLNGVRRSAMVVFETRI
jgi:hypothetical protein